MDGGLTWKRIIIPDSINTLFTNIYFTDAYNGWLTSANSLLRTNTGGTTWQKIQTIGIFDVNFFDQNVGYATTTDAALFFTFDGGTTLFPLRAPGTGTALFFLNQGTGWIAGANLNITNNAGASFIQSVNTLNPNETRVQFTDTQNGWIAGPVLYKTVDRGVTIQTINLDTQGNSDVHFFDSLNGYIMTAHAIYTTIDGAVTFKKICNIQKSLLSVIHFTDTSHGWAIGSAGKVYVYVKL